MTSDYMVIGIRHMSCIEKGKLDQERMVTLALMGDRITKQ